MLFPGTPLQTPLIRYSLALQTLGYYHKGYLVFRAWYSLSAPLRAFWPCFYCVQERLDLARELGVGVSVWELGQGMPYFFDLL